MWGIPRVQPLGRRSSQNPPRCIGGGPPRLPTGWSALPCPPPLPLAGYQCNVLIDLAARRRFFSWCTERNVVELYIGSVDAGNTTQMGLLGPFVQQAHSLGIDIQFCVGDGLGEPGQVDEFLGNVRLISNWCEATAGLCGSDQFHGRV